MLRQEIVVKSDVVQATDKAHTNVIQGSNFSTEEDVVTYGLEVEDVIDTRSCTLRSIRSIHCQLGHTAMTFQSDIVPYTVVDIQSGHSHQTFSTSTIETILDLLHKIGAISKI
jgi:hypothetical protein